MKNKIVIIGLDGVPYRAIEKLSRKGIMENTRRIITDGTFCKMASSLPEVSSVAWSSIITGKNPAEHGIFGFTDLKPDTYQMYFPNFNNLKAAPFWAADEKSPSVIINVPSTYPVKPLNGAHISGFISLDFEKSIYPDILAPALKNLNYEIDVDASSAHKSIELFLRNSEKTLEARIKAYRYLWNYCDWRTFMLVFTNTDRLAHFLWDAYEDENHKYHENFINHFRKIDEVIGEIAGALDKNDLLFLVSDHGFELLEENVNINYLLREAGFLEFKENADQSLINVTSSTKAFALDPARIYVNTSDKYPGAQVNPREKNKVIEELKKLFGSLERNGRKVIRDIYEKDEIFEGAFKDAAPDLVLVAAEGFNLKANMKAGQIYEKNIFTGKHTRHDAFFLSNKKCENILTKNFSVCDFLGAIKAVEENL